MKTAVITGASSGLGREFVRQFHSVFPEIERVWLIARRTDRLQELAEQLEEKGLSVLTLSLDLCDTMSFTAYHEHLVEEQLEIALLVNNAGCGYLGNIGEIDTVSQTRMIDLNLRALTAITNLSVPYMEAGSRILNVSLVVFAFINEEAVVCRVVCSLRSFCVCSDRSGCKDYHGCKCER